jgi:exosortase A-associated hydrolase 1
MPREHPIFFNCAGDQLLGILHDAEGTGGGNGVLLVVGGPQYRVGSHRQFVLLARELAASGIPVFRFDYRGMGDSAGEARSFDDISEDIRAALATFYEHAPTLRRVVLWGLCDAATAIAFYSRSDERVIGQVALNPWVRTLEGEAQALIKHYYRQRVRSAAFWRKVLSMQFNAAQALRDFFQKLGLSRLSEDVYAYSLHVRPLPRRLSEAQMEFAGSTLLILSGQDLTAKEYEMRVSESPRWSRWMESPQVEVRRLTDADHTFSRAAWHAQVVRWTRDWILGLPTD